MEQDWTPETRASADIAQIAFHSTAHARRINTRKIIRMLGGRLVSRYECTDAYHQTVRGMPTTRFFRRRDQGITYVNVAAKLVPHTLHPVYIVNPTSTPCGSIPAQCASALLRPNPYLTFTRQREVYALNVNIEHVVLLDRVRCADESLDLITIVRKDPPQDASHSWTALFASALNIQDFFHPPYRT